MDALYATGGIFLGVNPGVVCTRRGQPIGSVVMLQGNEWPMAEDQRRIQPMVVAEHRPRRRQAGAEPVRSETGSKPGLGALGDHRVHRAQEQRSAMVGDPEFLVLLVLKQFEPFCTEVAVHHGAHPRGRATPVL